MTCFVEWKGQTLDIDPMEFTGLEYSLIKQRTGLTYRTLVEGLKDNDGDAIRALFWVAMRRTDPELKFSEFEGPPLKFYLAQLDKLGAAIEETGKELNLSSSTSESDGSPSSPSAAATPEPTISL